MNNPVGFSLNVKVCVPIIVTGLGNRQLDNDLKFCITGMMHRIISLTMNISTLCVIFMIKTNSKSKIDTRIEFSDLK